MKQFFKNAIKIAKSFRLIGQKTTGNKGIAASRAGRCYLRLQFAISFGWGQDEQCWAFVCYLLLYNFIQQRLGSDIATIPACSNTQPLATMLLQVRN